MNPCTGEERLSVDGFQFKHFPLKWTSTDVTAHSFPVLNQEQIYEIREFVNRPGKSKSRSTWTYHTWWKYFNLEEPGTRSKSEILAVLSRRRPRTSNRNITNDSLVASAVSQPHVEQESQDSGLITDGQRNEQPLQPILHRYGGTQMCQHLETGFWSADNPKARTAGFQRNRVPVDARFEGPTSSDADIIHASDRAMFGIVTFDDIPIYDRANGTLKGNSLSGQQITLHIESDPNQAFIINRTKFDNRFLDQYLQGHEDARKIFSAEGQKQSKYGGKQTVSIFRKLVREIMFRMKFWPIFENHEATESARFGSRQRLQAPMSVFQKSLEAAKEQYKIDDQCHARHLATLDMFQKHRYEFRNAMAKCCWLGRQYSPSYVRMDNELKRCVVLASVTEELSATPTEIVNKYITADGKKLLDGSVQFEAGAFESWKEVKDGTSFLNTQGCRRHTQSRSTRPPANGMGGSGLGKQAGEQGPHVDAESEGVITLDNWGEEPTALGIYLNSGWDLTTIASLGRDFKKTFDCEFPKIDSVTRPGKKLKDVMIPGGTDEEKVATAWTYFADTTLRRKRRVTSEGYKWIRKYLQIDSEETVVFGMQLFHFGARFPLAFRKDGAQLSIPKGLFRFCVHDYHGHDHVPSQSSDSFSPTNETETTVDIRVDPVLCAGCEYWGSEEQAK